MLVSYNWLKQYVKLPDSLSAEELGLKLTMSTVEVEGIDDLSKSLDGIVVGKILKIEKHSDADKLQVVKVDVGEKLKIVCGGSNLKEGMLVVVAKLGAKVLWHGEGEPVEMKKTKIRGVESLGMICASEEVGLGDVYPKQSDAEILDLSGIVDDKMVGELLAQALGLNDVVFDIDNKSMTHRPDLWGHYGMAREVAALYNKDLKKYNFSKIKAGKEFKIKVEVKDQKLCPRYMAVAVSGIEVKESPAWLKNYLTAVGLRPINNIVDITNYILMDLGQPMHAFHAKHLMTIDKIGKDKTIVVRRAKNKEEFTTLDGEDHILDDSMLVIADEEKPVALAGIMGGLNSEINNDTTTVILESANFEAVNIRKTAVKLGLRTDSSSRFEKSLDPLNAELAILRAVELIKEVCPKAKVASNVNDVSNFVVNSGPIELEYEFINKKIGQEIKVKEIIKILESLGFEVKEKKDRLIVEIPSWRATKDISIAEDLIEEISRIYGYDNITPKLPVFPITPPEINELKQLERKMLDLCVKEFGFSQVDNYSFVSGRQIENLGGVKEKYTELDNPLSKEKPFLRRNLILNLLENLEKNIEFFDVVKLVEVGKVFLPENSGLRMETKGDELLPEQDIWVTGLFASKKEQEPFWEVKKVAERLATVFDIGVDILITKNIKPWQHSGRIANLIIGKEVVGTVSELNPLKAENFGLDVRVGLFEINLDKFLEVLKKIKPEKKYQIISEFPEMVRDISMTVKTKIDHQDIVAEIKKVDELINNVELFDIYLGEHVEKGSKSMAYHIVYGSFEKTLKTEDVDKVHKKVVKKLQDKFGVEIRK